jgi:ComF family protein
MTHFSPKKCLSKVKGCLTKLGNTLFPQSCILCHSRITTAPAFLICEECEQSLPIIQTSCALCSTPLSTNSNCANLNSAKSNSDLCGYCLNHQRPWQNCIVSFHYSEPISSLIHRFKYQHELRLIGTLSQKLIEEIRYRDSPLPDALVPVPMHSKRLAKRGYNHAAVLAKQISTQLNIPRKNIVKKTIETTQLVTLKESERKNALKNSFELNKNYLSDIKNWHIAIIDDVMTTGTTATKIAKLLAKSGCENIEVWCIART